MRAEADGFDDFLRARDQYANLEYATAATAFAALIAQGPPEGARATWWPMARTLYAASLLNLHAHGTPAEIAADEAAAVRAVESALRDEPDTAIDGEQFDLRFSVLFNAVRNRMQPELTRLRDERARARQGEAKAAQARRREALRLMTTEARTVGTRWTAALPFGGAQFANRQPVLGVFFLSIEVIAVAGSVTTFMLQQSVDTSTANLTDQDLRLRVRLIEGLNYTFVGIFGAAVLGGLIQALVAYSPQTSTVVRPLPPSLRNVQISLSPGVFSAPGLSLAVTF